MLSTELFLSTCSMNNISNNIVSKYAVNFYSYMTALMNYISNNIVYIYIICFLTMVSDNIASKYILLTTTLICLLYDYYL